MTRLNLNVAKGTADHWQAVALRLGCEVDRGPLKGRGSVSQLVNGLVSGDVSLAAFTEAFKAGLTELPVVSDGQLTPDDAPYKPEK